MAPVCEFMKFMNLKICASLGSRVFDRNDPKIRPKIAPQPCGGIPANQAMLLALLAMFIGSGGVNCLLVLPMKVNCLLVLPMDSDKEWNVPDKVQTWTALAMAFKMPRRFFYIFQWPSKSSGRIQIWTKSSNDTRAGRGSTESSCFSPRRCSGYLQNCRGSLHLVGGQPGIAVLPDVHFPYSVVA